MGIIVHLFGLTGGIASGKTTVAGRFRVRGLAVIDADELARDAVAPETPCLRAIVEDFGPSVLRGDGSLDRKRLATIVFSDAGALGRLNAITHPEIARRMAEQASALSAAGEPLSCYEAALIIESGAADKFRPLVVVSCPRSVQLARMRARSAISDGDAIARIAAQMPLNEKVALADYVVDTSGSLEKSAIDSDNVLRAICIRLGVAPARYFPS